MDAAPLGRYTRPVESIHRAVSIVAAAGIVQGLFLALAILRKGGGTRWSDRCLASLLLLISAAIAVPEFGFPEGAAPLHIYLLVIGAFQLALGPLLLAYARSLRTEIGGLELYPRRRARALDAAHAIPLAAYLGLLLLMPGSSRQDASAIPQDAASDAALKAVFAAVLAHSLSYLAVVLISLHGLTRRLKTRLSDLRSLDLSWLRFFSIVLIGACAIIAAYAISVVNGHPYRPGDKTFSLVLASLVYALGWRGLFQKAGPAAAEPAEPAETAAKYSRSGVRPSEAGLLLGALRRLMEEEKPYLDPGLTLGALAGEAGMSASDLSRIVNEAGGTNFYDFVNGYRVEEAKRLLADGSHRDRNILDIAYGSGFRSKSTFNDCFKRLTGRTPKDFRRESPPA
jgi:AraC-like DNA-binding protein